MFSPTPPNYGKDPSASSLHSQVPTHRSLTQQPLSLPRLSPSIPPGLQAMAQGGVVLSLSRPGFAIPRAGAPLLTLWGLL